ncbi:CARDB domain-containing protein [Halobaculum gomorrense]|uniref:CARDB protein n=1 Tax=Halobaculum gomorrense TaxID=43928 RepID=A0A1M5LT02_9EURY|nr:CARDB domain-containing protein [Halobaculum gomorrense]SHG68116.1 CARDB protein [Halobaculum gomorrense]
MQQRGFVALAVVCLVSSLAAPAVAAPTVGGAGAGTVDTLAPSTPSPVTATTRPSSSGAASASSLAAASTATGGDIRLTTTLALTPDRAGSVAVTLRFEVPDRVTAVEATIAADAAAVRTDGFAATDGDTYEWDGETATPTISYRLPANRTASTGRLGRSVSDGPQSAGSSVVDGSGPVATAALAAVAAAGDEGYLFVDPGPWALVQLPGTGVSWRYRGETVGLSRRAATEGAGAVGGRVAFLGEHVTRERTANAQTFRLVVPAASGGELAPQPERVLDSLASASGALRVGDRDESVFLVAAPAGVDWAVRGLQTGDADAWVRADEPLTGPQSAWLHEYVHTRQSFATTAETRWMVEGAADYYAALLALRQGLTGFSAFADHLERGAEAPYADDVLADPSTWTTGTPYRKGSLVAGETDRRIRLASDGGATLATVLTRLNAESEPVTADRFHAIVAAAGNESAADATARFVRTDAAPDMWSASAHEAAFGRPVARIAVDPPSAVAVEGAYRNASLDTPATVAVGETLTVPVAVSNVGGAVGDYRVALAANDRTVAVANGTLAAGENATVPLSWTPTAPGAYALTVRGWTYEVFVEEPSAPTAASVSLNRTAVVAGDAVLVTAEVVADGAVPAAGDVAVRVGGRVVATERVRVGPDAPETLRVAIRVDEPGDHVVSVGDASASLTVEPADGANGEVSPAADGSGDIGVSAPGFGAGAAAASLALALAAAALAGRRSEG